ncbi:unnamed protein product [Closterium sp. NIES-53]
MAPGQQASAVDMAVEGAEDEEEEGLEAATSTEAAEVADTAMTTRTTDAVADGSTASVIFATRADTCGAIATNSLMDGLLLKAKRVEEQEEGEEEAVEAVAVAEVVLQSLDYWVIDSGATYSMTPRADFLTDLEPSPVKHVTSALGQRAEVKGMGKAKFKGADRKMVGLKNHLVKNEMVAGIRVKAEPDEILGCPTCMQAKFTHFPFSSSEATAKAPLDEVVMDVVGPLKLGAAGAEYFLTIVDVCTRMTWVYVLSKKSDVAETVKTDWLLIVERQQDRLVNTSQGGLGGSDAEEWKKAMESELTSIEENGTWELVELPEGREAITSKWLFKIKSDAGGKIERYKSRLVATGYQQKEKVDYKELFALVVKPTTMRTLLAGFAIKGWVVKQMDVTTAFLYGILEEEIFMAQRRDLSHCTVTARVPLLLLRTLCCMASPST